MSEHVALFVDRLVASTAAHGGESPLSIAVGRASFSAKKAPPFKGKPISHQRSSSSMPGKDVELHRSGSKNSILDGSLSNMEDASKPHLAAAAAGECRICQEEDDIINLESPCACTGSLKFAHRKCVQHWCNEKGDTVCEICRKPYEGGYTAPPSSARADGFTINIGASWEGQQLNLPDSRLFSVASEHHFLDSDYEEYARANARSAACFRAVAFILMVLLLLRHISSMTSTVAEDDVLTFILLFFPAGCWILLALLCYGTCLECAALQTPKTGSFGGCGGCIPFAEWANSRSANCCFSSSITLWLDMHIC